MFYTYYQNNSGGVLYKDENVGEYVVIEGQNIEEINKKAIQVFKDYMGYCKCCGERWIDLHEEEESELEKHPSVLYKDENEYNKGKTIVIYYQDGSKKKFEHK